MQVEQVYQAAFTNLTKKVGELKAGQTSCPLTRKVINQSDMKSAQSFRNVFLMAAYCIAEHSPEQFADKEETTELSKLVSAMSEDERIKAEHVLDSLYQTGLHPDINEAQFRLLASWGITGKNFVNARVDNVNKIGEQIKMLETSLYRHSLSNLIANMENKNQSYHNFVAQAKETIQTLEHQLQDRQNNDLEEQNSNPPLMFEYVRQQRLNYFKQNNLDLEEEILDKGNKLANA
jgi:hypothetical protein